MGCKWGPGSVTTWGAQASYYQFQFIYTVSLGFLPFISSPFCPSPHSPPLASRIGWSLTSHNTTFLELKRLLVTLIGLPPSQKDG